MKKYGHFQVNVKLSNLKHMKDLEILIQPSLDSTRESMDYEEHDDYDSDAVLYQQGFDMDVMSVSPGERFSIGNEYTGQISCDEVQYEYKIKGNKDYDFEDYYVPGDPIELKPGSYIFKSDGIIIEKVK